MDIQGYIDLLTSAHHTKPAFVATVRTTIDPLAKLQAELSALPTAFDLDSAVGVQLDVCGEWIGLSRNIPTPLIGVYFAWGTVGVGWGEGSWKAQFDSVDGLTSLPDDLYRLVLKARVALNHWDGSIPGAYAAWNTIFSNDLVLSIQDHQDMSITVGLSGAAIDAAMRSLLINGQLEFKPSGVRIRYYAVPPTPGALFAWGALPSAGFDGWGVGQWADHLVPSP